MGKKINRPKTIILLGPPGSGKDTQAFALAKKYGYFVLVTGDLFRAEVAHKTPIGQKMQKIMDQGELLPSDLADEVVAGEMERHQSTIAAVGVLFDGYPRLWEEIAGVERLIDRYRLRPDMAILLDVDEKNLTSRLMVRGRADDTPEVIQKRIKVFQKETGPVIDYYRKKGNLVVVDGNPDVEAVTRNVIAAIENLDRGR